MQGSCGSSRGQLMIYLPLYSNSLQQRYLSSYARLPLQSPDRNGGSSRSQVCWTAHRKVRCCSHPLQQHYNIPTVITVLTARNSAAYGDRFIYFKVLLVRYNYHDILLSRGSGLVDKVCYFCKWITMHQSTWVCSLLVYYSFASTEISWKYCVTEVTLLWAGF